MTHSQNIQTRCTPDIAADQRGRNQLVAETEAETHRLTVIQLLTIKDISKQKLPCLTGLPIFSWTPDWTDSHLICFTVSHT